MSVRYSWVVGLLLVGLTGLYCMPASSLEDYPSSYISSNASSESSTLTGNYGNVSTSTESVTRLLKWLVIGLYAIVLLIAIFAVGVCFFLRWRPPTVKPLVQVEKDHQFTDQRSKIIKKEVSYKSTAKFQSTVSAKLLKSLSKQSLRKQKGPASKRYGSSLQMCKSSLIGLGDIDRQTTITRFGYQMKETSTIRSPFTKSQRKTQHLKAVSKAEQSKILSELSSDSKIGSFASSTVSQKSSSRKFSKAKASFIDQ